MNKISNLLRSRRGETMVEILVSMMIIVMLLAAFGKSLSFASHAPNKSRELRNETYAAQKELRDGTSITWNDISTGSFTLEALNQRTKIGSGSTDSKSNVQINKVKKTSAVIHGINVVNYKEAP